MTQAHHPDGATLMSFAAGSLPEALSAVVSTHLVACTGCRSSVRNMEDLGALLMGEIEQEAPSQIGSQAHHHALALRLIGADIANDAPPAVGADSDANEKSVGGTGLDAIERLTGHRLENIPWKRLGWGVWHYPIPLKGEVSGDLRLVKVQPGQAMPEHGHGGSELTLVLEGAYHDELGTFAAGCVADLDDSVEHRPVADPKTGCICLIASEQKARFTGVIGRLLQPMTGL